MNEAIVFGKSFKVDTEGFIKFNELGKDILGMSVEYASYYVWVNPQVCSSRGRRKCNDGLRFKHLESGNYKNYLIHKDDVEIFVLRLKDFKFI